MPTNGKYSLYFHVPFCAKKCPYCHFYVIKESDAGKKLLMSALKAHWDKQPPLPKQLVSLYFGGGTPSLLGPDNVGEIVRWTGADSSCEITLEANPTELTYPLLKSFADAGINRLSLGVQSFDDQILKTLGREHTSKKCLDAIFMAEKAGFNNITIDLMYDIPGQSLMSWQESLSILKDLPITHLSLYNLTFEEGTPFFRKKKELLPQVPDPETSLHMLECAVTTLEHIGLHRYEISAFAKPGFESRHNTGYWIGRPFLGFGPSAYSDWAGRRFRNISDLKEYATRASPIDFEDIISPTARLRERFAIALRLLQGTPLTIDPAIITPLIEKGWLDTEGSLVRLTPQGRLFYDTVAENIIE
jgi:oxygen-independent coproporphyrinogen-3 oxidase